MHRAVPLGDSVPLPVSGGCCCDRRAGKAATLRLCALKINGNGGAFEERTFVVEPRLAEFPLQQILRLDFNSSTVSHKPSGNNSR